MVLATEVEKILHHVIAAGSSARDVVGVDRATSARQARHFTHPLKEGGVYDSQDGLGIPLRLKFADLVR